MMTVVLIILKVTALVPNACTKGDKSGKKLVIFPIFEVKPLNNTNNPSLTPYLPDYINILSLNGYKE